jgi:triosephosphate isomerase
MEVAVLQKNADELFKCDNIDGGLIGGAALDADSFCSIIEALK